MDHSASRAVASVVTMACRHGQESRHIPSDNNCGACHTRRVHPCVWTTPNLVVRAAAMNSCRSCHSACGRRPCCNHVPTTQDCGACHGTLSWSPARFDHSGIAGNCRAVTTERQPGKVANHMTTFAGLLHVYHYPNWSAVTFVHTWRISGRHHSSRDARPVTPQHRQGDLAVCVLPPGCGGCHAGGSSPTGTTRPSMG